MSFNFASLGEFVPKCGFNHVDLTSFLQAQTQFVPGDQKTPTQLQDCAKKCEHQLCAANGKPHNFKENIVASWIGHRCVEDIHLSHVKPFIFHLDLESV